MRTIPLGISVSPTSINCPSLNHRKPITFYSSSSSSSSSSPSSSSSRLCNSTDDSLVSIAKSDFVLFAIWVLLLGFIIKLFVAKLPKLQKIGVCRATQVVDLFPSVSPEIVVREARLEDCWEVAETHCSCFFPEYSFPLDFVLRIDRLTAMLAGFSLPSGCRRTCLVAVIGSSIHETVLFGSEDLKIFGFNGKFSLNRGYVAGILTVDTVADFLPRKGPLRQRRTGIAYISNVAVRERFRRKGIAKRLIAKAETQAWSWGCRAIALHCDLNNPGATKLYKSLGFKCIKVPEGANWPQPRTSPDVKFTFMMKLLNTPTSA